MSPLLLNVMVTAFAIALGFLVSWWRNKFSRWP